MFFRASHRVPGANCRCEELQTQDHRMLELIAVTLPKAAALRGSRQYVDLPSRLVNNVLLFTSLHWQSGPHDWAVTRSSPPRWPSFAEAL
jgi:hypothetical protein